MERRPKKLIIVPFTLASQLSTSRRQVMQRLNRFFALALSVVFSLQAVAARDLPNGKYLILPAGNSSPSPPPVGFNVNGPTNPVIVGGKNHVWRVTPMEGGTYTIISEQDGPPWLTHVDQEQVFVSLKPLPQEWRVQQYGNNEYSIEIPNNLFPAQGWTLGSTARDTAVKIGVFEYPGPGQLWNFLPTREE
ncbi:hypothetical protein BKA57DRAFT_476128 [Linnemannia elongata]|nr:hypothetical protein BKA57DRAFT_476128 [Linnemannia elongata]